MKTIYHSSMTDKENFKTICDLTTNVLGLRTGSLSYKSRKQDYQVARMVASVIGLKEEQIHKKTIAEVLNRDRSLIYHYEKMHPGNIRWEKYRDAFNKVYNAYQDLIDSRKIFYDRYLMKDFLLRNGVKPNVKNDIQIKITSGKAVVVIPTSYFDFSNQLEIIKFILKDYSYKIIIQ